MNDHRLDADLRAFHITRTQLPDPPELHQRVLALAFDDIPQRRSWLPRPDAWGFKPMFDATKLLVAGVVVALFGGFVLAGVLTQPADETAPIAGASASGEIRTDLLPGVELEVEKLGPRLIRVLGDGHRYLDRHVVDVAVAPSGDAWIQRPNGKVHQLGEPGSAFQDRDASFERGPDGTLWVGRRQLAGSDWVFMPRSDDDVRFCVGGGRHLAPDGTCWQSGVPTFDAWKRGDTSARSFFVDSLEGYSGLGVDLAVARDGTVWSTLFREPDPGDDEGLVVGVASYDGSTWTAFESDLPITTGLPAQIAVAPDGVVWLVSWTIGGGCCGPPPILVMTWDGEMWTNHGAKIGIPGGSADIDFLPDGTPWFGRFAELEGDALRPIKVLAPVGGTPVVDALASTREGFTWAVVNQPDEGQSGLYLITPETATPTE